jgi:hypothetical protein
VTDDDLDIPPFLRVENRPARTTIMTTPRARSPRERRQDKPRPFWMPKGGLEEAGWAILKQQQAEAKAKQAERLAKLRERRS